MLNYRIYWDKFTKFISCHPNTAFPYSPSDVAKFTIYLVRAHYRPSTIRSHSSAIASIHKLNDCIDPVNTYLVKRVLKGVINSQAHTLPKLLPISKRLLDKMIAVLPYLAVNYDSILYKALFLVSYYCCTRASETTVGNKSLHTLQFNDITVALPPHPPQIKVLFKSSKHCSSQISLVLNPQEKGPCPLYALLEYMTFRGDSAGALFLSSSGSPATRYHFAKMIKKCLSFLSIDPATYNTHSFRIGRTTDLAAAGAPPSIIQSTGRWHSNAYQKYIRFGLISFPST